MMSTMRTLGSPSVPTVAKATSRIARKKRRHHAASTSSGDGTSERLSPSPVANAAMSLSMQMDIFNLIPSMRKPGRHITAPALIEFPVQPGYLRTTLIRCWICSPDSISSTMAMA